MRFTVFNLFHFVTTTALLIGVFVLVAERNAFESKMLGEISKQRELGQAYGRTTTANNIFRRTIPSTADEQRRLREKFLVAAISENYRLQNIVETMTCTVLHDGSVITASYSEFLMPATRVAIELTGNSNAEEFLEFLSTYEDPPSDLFNKDREMNSDFADFVTRVFN